MSAFSVAYLINQYPKVSHSFIRREIQALERQGGGVLRLAVRGWDAEVVDSEDEAERGKTRYVLREGLLAIVRAMGSQLWAAPQRFFSALGLAMRMSVKAERSLPFHLIYFAEACVVAQWLRQEKIPHLHAHFGTNPAEVAMLAARMAQVSYSFTVHGPEEFDKPQFIGLEEKIKHARFVVAISSFGRSQLYRWIRSADWPKVQVVHCGLDPAFFEGQRARMPAAPRLVCVGRLCEQKGQLLLVQAAHALMQQGYHFELILAGDGEMREEVQSWIQRLHLEAIVQITGWVSSDRVRQLILDSRALVLPSFAEGLPVVLMEAMSLGRPVISTTVAGIPELVRSHMEGWLCTPGSIDDLIQAMKICLDAPTQTLDRMGEAAYERVVRRHHIDVEAAKLAELFIAAAPVQEAVHSSSAV
jgi:colanic acid/amylovoran biosynthesis glycosyltransferase